MIYDCFVFSEETEVLEIRLRELAGVVDQFVLVEASHTFRGSWRTPIWPKIKEDFWGIAPNVTYVPVSELLPLDPWAAEAYVRNQIMRGLTRVNHDDIVLISDVDEIPRASTVCALNPKDGEVISLVPRSFYYTLDWEVPMESHLFPAAVLKGNLTTPQEIRLGGGTEAIDDAGWHFSCLGDAERLSTKLKSFAHSECDTPEITDVKRLAECIRTGKDLLGRFDCIPVDVDETYPQWVQDNLDKLGHLLRERA